MKYYLYKHKIHRAHNKAKVAKRIIVEDPKFYSKKQLRREILDAIVQLPYFDEEIK